MTILFVNCRHCGAHVTDYVTLMGVKKFKWKCPSCGKTNAPINFDAASEDDIVIGDTPEEE